MTAKDGYARCRQETSVQKRKRYLVNTEREREIMLSKCIYKKKISCKHRVRENVKLVYTQVRKRYFVNREKERERERERENGK